MLDSGVFYYNASNFVFNVAFNQTTPVASTFDEALLSKWTKAHDTGQCKYILKTQCRRIPGKYGFVAQLNAQRLERRTPQSFHNVNMPFDSKRFNFTKIGENEILLKVQKTDRDIAKISEEIDLNSNPEETLHDVFVINISPFAIGHMLIVPRLQECRPQVLTQHAIQLGIETQCLSALPNFIVVFNGMCANASVNHLHLHSYYFHLSNDTKGEVSNGQNCCNNELLVQRDNLDMQPLQNNCFICHFPHMSAIVFQVLTVADIPNVASQILSITNYFVQEDIAHNMCIVKAAKILPPGTPVGNKHQKSFNSVRVFLWPRRKVTGAKTENNFNVAVCELSGHAFLQPDYYETMTEDGLISMFAKDTLPGCEFDRIVEKVKQLLHSQ